MIAGGIDYIEAGDSDGAPVVFLHGIGSDAASFCPLIGALPGHRGIAWSMPGYGASERGAWPPSFASLSLSLSGFLGALGIERAHLVGHSIGGMVALEYAVRQPEQVESLTLIGTTPAFGGRDDSFKRQFLEARLAPLEAGLTMIQMAEDAAPYLMGPNPDPAAMAAIVGDMGRVPEETWRGILECLVTFNRRDALADLDLPCCLIAGEHDTNAPAKTMAKMAEALPDAEYSVLQGVGHMIPQEAPDRVAQIIAAFLEDLQ